MKTVRVAAVVSSLALVLALSGRVARGAAATSPGEPGTHAAEVGNEAEATTAALVTVTEKLGQLELTVESLRNALPASGEAVARLKPMIESIEAGLLETRSEVQRLPSIEQISAVTNNSEMKLRLDRLIDKVDSMSGDLRTLDALRQDLKAFDSDKSSDDGYPRLAMIFSAVAAVFGLGAILSVVALRPKGAGDGGAALRRLGEMKSEVLAEIAKVAAAAKSSGPSTPTAPPVDVSGPVKEAVAALGTMVGDLRAQVQAATRDRETVGKSLQQLEAAGARLQPAIDVLEGRVRELESARAAITDERNRIDQQKSAMESAARAQADAAAAQAASAATAASSAQLQTAEAALAEYDKLWPEAFRNSGALASWKLRIVAAVGQGKADATTLMTALMRWQAVRLGPQQDRDRWLEATDAVGRACHVFLGNEPAEDDAAALERLQQWTRAFKTPLEEAFPSLKLNAVYPGDRFDTDRMEAVSSISGGRQTVHHPLSWFVLEKSGETTRVLKRAQVTTA